MGVCSDELVIRAAAWPLLLCLGASMHLPRHGRKTVVFHFTKGPGEMSCQRLHLRLVMKLGIPCRALKFYCPDFYLR